MTAPLRPSPLNGEAITSLGRGSPDSATHAPVGNAGRPLRRLSELLAEAAQILADLAETDEIQLAAGGDQSVMDDVTTATNEPPPGTALVTIPDLAERLQVAERTVRRWRADGELPPAIEFGGLLRWRPEVIDAWIAEREEGSE